MFRIMQCVQNRRSSLAKNWPKSVFFFSVKLKKLKISGTTILNMFFLYKISDLSSQILRYVKKKCLNFFFCEDETTIGLNPSKDYILLIPKSIYNEKGCFLHLLCIILLKMVFESKILCIDKYTEKALIDGLWSL